MSDDGRHGLTAIAFLGSVFSPAYFAARKAGAADPLRHCAINLALYGPAATWVMTERDRGIDRGAAHLCLGSSSVRWEGDALVVEIDERSSPFPAPLPRRVRGRSRSRPAAPAGPAVELAPGHRWWPVAPVARIEVEMEAPQLRWSGAGYHDTNQGDAPLDVAFRGWSWGRTSSTNEAAIHYDVVRADGARHAVALRCDRDGVAPAEPAPWQRVRRSAWGIERQVRGEALRLTQTMEDTPFYTRSLLSGRLGGAPAVTVHEALSLERFRSGWVRFLLPFRMRRER